MAMRMGPFSHPGVIKYINQYFAPIFVSNEDYRSGKLGEQEKHLLANIRKTAKSKGLSGGAVQVYLLKPNADVIDVMHVAKATYLKQLMPWLRKVSQDFGTVPGKTLVPPSTTLKRPSVAPDEIALHFRGQLLNRQTSYVDDWVVLQQEEWSEFIHSANGPEETQWQITPTLAKKILLRFYPYSADWQPQVDEIHSAKMQVRVIKQDDKVRTLAVDGSIERVQNKYPGHSPNRVSLVVAGMVKVAGSIPEITLTTYRAEFGDQPFEGLMLTTKGEKQTDGTSSTSGRQASRESLQSSGS